MSGKRMEKVGEISSSMFGLFIIIILIMVPTTTEQQTGFTRREEVEALHEVAIQMGKTDWTKLTSDPCSKDPKWTKPFVNGTLYDNRVVCDCSYTEGVCHVVELYIKGQNLSSNLPIAIAKLPYLKKLDLAMNCFIGNIPREWAYTKLEFLSLYVNNLTGQLPGYLGDIATLKYLSVECNQFTGIVPPELGKLSNLETLFLTANNFSGKLPSSLSKLTRLKEFSINSNYFVGKIPDFIGSWKNLDKLWMLASGLEGPIPQSISALTNLTELRISDLNGEGSYFPQLLNMKSIKHLILRNCSLFGSIPDYIMQMEKLKSLDLTFNRFQGSLPTDYNNLNSINNMYLTSNWLNGSIPTWFSLRNRHPGLYIDVSYNNFSESSLPKKKCVPVNQLNLFKSTRTRNNPEAIKCHDCTKDQYSLHINCGGPKTIIKGIVYVEDQTDAFPAVYEQKDWGAVSTTGHFWDHTNSSDASYIAKTMSVLKMRHSQLYQNGRLTPVSLTYYVDCLANGSYTVKLHFAEIVIRDNISFYSFVRRVFDVYIQDQLVLRDFNIIKAARGADKVYIHKSKAVVTNGTLEIRFYWAGRGTTTGPLRYEYGPLISAIDVESDFRPLNWKFIIAGIVVSVVLLIFIIIGTLWRKGRLGGRTSGEQEFVGLDPQTIFSFKQIKAATNDFDQANKIGEGGFGPVHKGTLSDDRGEEQSLKLDWCTRQRICVGMAKGLAFLHEESALKIVHRDIKATNILLDGDLNPKISDFGLAKLDEEENTHISTRIAGTIGYMAPEYALWGHLTDKADVYSFGVVALELVAGQSNMKNQQGQSYVCLVDYALVLQQKENLLELIDPRLGSEFNEKEVTRVIKVALLCTNPSPANRPTMSKVVSMLEGQTDVPEVMKDLTKDCDELRFKAMRNQFEQLSRYSPNESQVSRSSASESRPLVHSSTDSIWVGSSSSTSGYDLYPLST